MKNYEFLAKRYYKFFKYLRTVGLVSLIIFLIVTALNTGNSTLSMISFFFMLVTFACVVECCILYVMYILFIYNN